MDFCLHPAPTPCRVDFYIFEQIPKESVNDDLLKTQADPRVFLAEPNQAKSNGSYLRNARADLSPMAQT